MDFYSRWIGARSIPNVEQACTPSTKMSFEVTSPSSIMLGTTISLIYSIERVVGLSTCNSVWISPTINKYFLVLTRQGVGSEAMASYVRPFLGISSQG